MHLPLAVRLEVHVRQHCNGLVYVYTGCARIRPSTTHCGPIKLTMRPEVCSRAASAEAVWFEFPVLQVATPRGLREYTAK